MAITQQQAEARATQLLTHYFSLIAQRAGVRWNSDNDIEVGEIVSLIFDEIRSAESRVQDQLDVPDWRDRR